ncbi:NUDIX domain-containing protein [Cryobacterium sp. BB307]|uniref:NUDIX domain-containing protein n=1 Tax=Cryobacterium sp. BB307 TaxID=2716317 RepID=UPI001446E7F8
MDEGLHGIAATVVLLRNGADGLEVLLLERPHDRGSFAGAWVFPGGAVDPEDAAGLDADSDEAAARVAAVREVEEETGLVVSASDLVTVSRWTPPSGIPKRMQTWFFYAPAASGRVSLHPDEAVAFQWIRPLDALERHAAGALKLFPPTWVTLHDLLGDATVADALARGRAADLAEFVTRFAGKTVLWHPDVAYDDDSLLDAEGPRHRLETGAMPWLYSRTRQR